MAKIRVWKLGSLDHKIYPTDENLNNLARCLQNIEPGKNFDLIWGPDLEVVSIDDVGDQHIVCGPNIRVTADGNILKIESRDESTSTN